MKFSRIHWSDVKKTDAGGFVDQGEWRRSRIRKIEYTNAILQYYGFKASVRTGGGYMVSNRTGRTDMCMDFGEIWQKVQTMSGITVDPLDEGLIQYLETRSA